MTRPLRSLLFCPATAPRPLAKLPAIGADSRAGPAFVPFPPFSPGTNAIFCIAPIAFIVFLQIASASAFTVSDSIALRTAIST